MRGRKIASHFLANEPCEIFLSLNLLMFYFDYISEIDFKIICREVIM